MNTVLKILPFLILTSCLEQKVTKVIPDSEKFKQDTELMINISHRLANEPNAEILNKVAVATQSSRVINCIDFAGECDLFRAFLSRTISNTSDGELTPLERAELKSLIQSLEITIAKARRKLKK